METKQEEEIRQKLERMRGRTKSITFYISIFIILLSIILLIILFLIGSFHLILYIIGVIIIILLGIGIGYSKYSKINKFNLEDYLDHDSHTTPIELDNIIPNSRFGDNKKAKTLHKKAIKKGIKRNELKGEFDEQDELYIPPSVKNIRNKLFSRLRGYDENESIDISRLADEFGLTEKGLIWHLNQLIETNVIDGEINRLDNTFITGPSFRKSDSTEYESNGEDKKSKSLEPRGKKEIAGQTISREEYKNSSQRTSNLPKKLNNKPTVSERKSRLRKEISELEEEESMIDTRAIESALDEGDIENAEELLGELKEKYQEYKETIDELEGLDSRKSSLAKKLADDEIDKSTYDNAIQNIEHEKADLEEKLNKLRKEVIHEDYEKPF